jgi:hypothetical protein
MPAWFWTLFVAALVASLSLLAAWLLLAWLGDDGSHVFAGAFMLSASLSLLTTAALKYKAYRGRDVANG